MKSITIRSFSFPKERLPELLKKHSVFINTYAEQNFSHSGFRTDCCPEELQIVITSLHELGFSRGATLKGISETLADFRLKPCHASTGLFLRIAWKEQEQSGNSVLTGTRRAPDSAVTVFSEPLEEDDAFPKGLYLRNVDGRLWLRGYVCDQDYRWSENDLFAFERTEQVPVL